LGKSENNKIIFNKKQKITLVALMILISASLSVMPVEGGGPSGPTLTITKLTTSGDGSFDFSVTGPTSFNPTIITSSGSGGTNALSVIAGTYSITETIPVDWNLITASCNDGSSSFSIDTVSGIVIGASDNIVCTFQNTFVGPVEPGQVTGLIATAMGTSTIDLAWTPPVADGGSPITGYKIERESPVAAGFSILVGNTGTTATTFQDTGLTPDTEYNYRVSAINAIGTGPVSNEAFTITDPVVDWLFEFGSFGTGDGLFNNPSTIAVDSSDRIFVGDNTGRIQVFDSSGNFLFKFGTFVNIQSVTVDSSDRIIVSDISLNEIQVFDSSGNFLFKFGSFGTGDGQFSSPFGVAVDNQDRIYVGEDGNSRVQVFDSSGNFLFKFGTPCNIGAPGPECIDPDGAGPLELGDGQFDDINDLIVDGFDRLLVLETRRVQVFDTSGNFLFKFGNFA